MTDHNESHATYDESYTAYQSKRPSWRRWVRRLYLRKAASFSRGAALDFGCGVGELLKRLPQGSIGVEYNTATVRFCIQEGLNVSAYDGFLDDFGLLGVPWQERVNTLYLSHVLEHFEHPVHILQRLAKCVETGIFRIVVIVPGKAGFRTDTTHRTFVDLPLIKAAVDEMPSWRITHAEYFPVNHQRFGDYFPYNELQVVIDRRVDHNAEGVPVQASSPIPSKMEKYS